MAVAVQIDDRVVVLVKEHQLPVQFRAVNLVLVDIKDAAQSLFHLRVTACLIKPCVTLEHMEQGVHGLCRHDTVFRELFVALRLPVDGKGLQIALAVGAVLLDEMKDLFCVGQRNGVFGQPVVSGKGIDGKALIVGVLGGVLRLAGVIAAPVHTAVCLVVAVFQEELVGVAGILGKVCPAGQHGRLGEEPQNAAVQDAALFGFFIQLQVKIHVAVKAAVFLVPQPFPEGNDGLQQHFFCCLFDGRHNTGLPFCTK